MKALWIWASLTLCRFQEVLLFFFTDAFFHEPVPGIKEIEKHQMDEHSSETEIFKNR